MPGRTHTVQTAIRNAPLGVFLAMVAVPLAMALVAVVAGFHARRQAAAVKDTSSTPIADAEDGYRQINGTVMAMEDDTLIAPLTGVACCWYTITVEQWTRPLQNPHRKNEWVAVRSETSSAPLLVRDDSGVCLVRPHSAEITPTDRCRWTGATLEPVEASPRRVGPGEPFHGMVQVSGLPGHEFRYREECIYAGDRVLVVGTVSHRADDEDEADLTPAELVTRTEIARGTSRQPFVITTVSPTEHVAMNEMGSQASFMIALLPLAIAAFVVLVRFS